MTASLTSAAARACLTPEIADALAAKFVGEMAERWRQGERALPEEFLARCPEIADHPQAAADLIYEEFCLRREYGLELPATAIFDRFPQWRPQLEIMFDCQELLEPQQARPQFPQAGDSFGDFLLLTELGRGVQGPVFLARQRSLGDRPVVLKFTPYHATEHLSLARLQHTNIVPLFSAQECPVRHMRTLCMPYFGGATLAQALEHLRTVLPWRRTGRDLLAAVDGASAAIATPGADAVANYSEAICQIGISLADALEYAHERGLVHLDLKPSNILIAADGQPMVLDFHLAQGPLASGDVAPQWFGGTRGYMSPEQEAGFSAARRGRRVPQSVDRRSDVYSLGAVMYEALGGPLRSANSTSVTNENLHDLGRSTTKPAPLTHFNSQVSAGLADILTKCMAVDPAQRYPSMAALAGDLRRHLANLPLRGARNRSPGERWRKWRRRRPHGMALSAMMLFALIAVSAVAVGALRHIADCVDHADAALAEAQSQIARGDWQAATNTIGRGLSSVRGLPARWSVAGELERRLEVAVRGRDADERAAASRRLHTAAEIARAHYGDENIPATAIAELANSCREFWAERSRIVEWYGAELGSAAREDLLDLAIFWANLRLRIIGSNGRPDALTMLAEAEQLFGNNPVIDQERRILGAPANAIVESTQPTTAWEHYALARVYLRSGNAELAGQESRRAVSLDPHSFWPNFYHGLCTYRAGRFSESAVAFSVCIGAAPESAGCYSNRALAFAAQGLTGAALRDYDRALRLDPTLTVAVLNRGRLHMQAGHYLEAASDFARAQELGTAAKDARSEFAVMHAARGEYCAALTDVFNSASLQKHLDNSAPGLGRSFR